MARAAKELPAEKIPIILQERQVKVAEKLNVFVLHPQLLGRVPVDHLADQMQNTNSHIYKFLLQKMNHK